MTASVLQFNNHAQNAGVTTWPITLPSVSQHSGLQIEAFFNDGRTITGITDSSGNTWAQVQAVTNGALQVAEWRAYDAAASAGTLTATITFDAGTATVGAAIRELGGVARAAAVDKYTGQAQATPGTSANAVTSGATATLSRQPGLVLGTSTRTDGTTAPTAGTGNGFASDGTGNAFYDSYAFRCESKRVTSTTGIAATFTANGAGDSFITLVSVWDELVTAIAAGLSQVSNQGGF